MTEAQSVAVYASLSQYVRDQGLDWILEQVTEQIRFGLESKKNVRVGADESWASHGEGSRTRRSNVMFAATRPYSEREKLKLLIDAIQQAIVNTTEMEASFCDSLQVLDVARTGILVREELNPRLIKIGEDSQLLRREDAQHLDNLLNELRSEI